MLLPAAFLANCASVRAQTILGEGGIAGGRQSDAKASLLVSGATPVVTKGEGRVTIEVPSIETLEVVHLTWA